jgi:hypothetical protein
MDESRSRNKPVYTALEVERDTFRCPAYGRQLTSASKLRRWAKRIGVCLEFEFLAQRK